MKKDLPGTLRQQIIQVLETGPVTIRDISQAVRASEKEVLAHLPHIEKSIRSQQKKIAQRPSRCINCGFEFRKRRKPSRPGKCPKCRQTRIQGALFQVIPEN